MNRALALLLISIAASLPALAGGSTGVRIKDITAVQGVRANQLVGYGLVVGLNGTGDSLRNSPFTQQSLQSMLDQMGVNIRTANPRTRNIAAVLVTADLPPFAGAGSRIDITVSSLGDASSLAGGSLVMTPLSGADGAVYAVGQGPVAVSGFGVQGRAESVSQNVPTTGRIPNGALVEREVAGALDDEGALVLELRNPDFGTAVRITDTINAFAKQRFGRPVAREQDLRSVSLQRPVDVSAARFLAEIGELYTEADGPARVVIDERTGTVVIGRDVQIQTVAVSHGSLTVRITEGAKVSQPEPFSDGETVVVPESFVTVNQEGANLAIMGGTNLETLVRGLNMMGLKPTGIIAILQAIKTSGALQAELVVQ
ncbi:flagellar basal body P-ring protein FlgI [uncultured Hyphomicrobium sp.]|uniref:flagellar basal body P-ring protein FlgI n=1 Tax=uncultured Hyphomicrobium sp. TaxID=194373 RepID=UPI0025D0CEE8|nr:flagellar basal body P-ring protein FlgI [uncultured Hyphomicrobium sp.]